MSQTIDMHHGKCHVRLADSALHALKWRYTGTACQVGLQFIIGVILARLLTPEAFGLVGMALIVVGFGRLIADLGFGVAIIQSPCLEQKHVRAALTGNVMMGLLLFGVLWVAAPSISDVFAQRTLMPVLRTIGVYFLLSGMSTTLSCLLRRELRFRTIALIETTSYAAGFGVVGVSMAICGYGVWSLVAANILQPVCLIVLALYATKLPLRPYFHFQEYHDLVRVAFAEMLNNVTNYFAENLDFAVTGKWLGASALGLYSRSFYLATLPMYQFSTGLSSVMFPLFSKIQSDPPRLGRAYLQTVSLTAMVTMPVLFGIASAPGVVIRGLFGSQWEPAAGALQVLCYSGSLWAVIYAGSAVSHARGYLFSEWRRQVIYFIVMVLAVWMLSPIGIQGVALAVAGATLTRYLLLAQLTVKLTGVNYRDFFLAQIPGCLLGVIVAATVSVTAKLGVMLSIPDVLLLCIIGMASMASLIVSLAVLPLSWLGDFYPWLNEHFGLRLPPGLRRIIAAKLQTSEA